MRSLQLSDVKAEFLDQEGVYGAHVLKCRFLNNKVNQYGKEETLGILR